MTVFDNEEDLGADSYQLLLTNFLPLYGCDIICVKFLVGDNCATNQSLAKNLKNSFNRMFKPSLNLAVNKYINDNNAYALLIVRIQKLTVFLRKIKMRGWLRKRTKLAPIKHNKTRWPSKHNMLKRYLEIKDVLIIDQEPIIGYELRQIYVNYADDVSENSGVDKMSSDSNSTDDDYVPNDMVDLVPGDSTTLVDYLLTLVENRLANELFNKLKQLDEVSILLQNDEITVEDGIFLLDYLVRYNPEMSHHLGRNAEIVHSGKVYLFSGFHWKDYGRQRRNNDYQ